MDPFWQGLTMGLAYVATIGLQNLFVINTALIKPFSQALLTALIVIFFDITLALACFSGAGALIAQAEFLKMAILLIGSLIVIWIGINLLRPASSDPAEAKTADSLWQSVTTACIVTWFNPQAIIDGTMMLGAFKAALSAQAARIFMIGVMSASCLWFIALTVLIACFQTKLTPVFFRWVNRICGAIIICYGLKLFWNFCQLLFF